MQNKELILNKILIIVFAMLLTLPALLFKITGDIDLGRNYEEKRVLASLPDKFNSDYFKNFAVYVNDHAFYRQTIITLNNIINQKCIDFYDRYINRKLFALLPPVWYKETDEYKQGIPYFVSAYHPKVIYGKEKWLFMRNLNSLRNYKGQNLLSEQQMSDWKDLYEKLDNYCRQKGISLAIMIIPNKSHVFSEYMPPYKIITENKREIALSNYLKENSKINFIYPLNELKSANKLHYTYYKQDSHWNYFGSYIGTISLYKQLGIPYIPAEQLKITEKPDYGGDLCNMCGYMNSGVDFVVDYKPEIKAEIIKNTDDFYSASIEKSISNGRKIVMVGDSYMKFFFPYLSKDFFSTKLYSLRAFEDKELFAAINELEKDDILFVESSERYDEKEHMPTIKRLIKIFDN